MGRIGSKDEDMIRIEILMMIQSSSVIPESSKIPLANLIARRVVNRSKLPTKIFTRKDLVELMPKDSRGYPYKYYYSVYKIPEIIDYLYLFSIKSDTLDKYK